MRFRKEHQLISTLLSMSRDRRYTAMREGSWLEVVDSVHRTCYALRFHCAYVASSWIPMKLDQG